MAAHLPARLGDRAAAGVPRAAGGAHAVAWRGWGGWAWEYHQPGPYRLV